MGGRLISVYLSLTNSMTIQIFIYLPFLYHFMLVTGAFSEQGSVVVGQV